MFNTYFRNCDFFSAIMQSTIGIFGETFKILKQKANPNEIFFQGTYWVTNFTGEALKPLLSNLNMFYFFGLHALNQKL